MIIGWFLFVISFLFQDIYSIMIAGHFHGNEGVKAVAVDQPGTVAAVFVGWLIPLVGHFIGKGLRRLVQIVGGGSRLTRSEQDVDPNA